MSPIEIGPDGTPIVTPKGEGNSVDAEGQEHSNAPFTVPTTDVPTHLRPVTAENLTDAELRGRNELTPHTDKKENDAMSEPSSPPPPHNLPPSLVPGVSSVDTVTAPASEVLDEMPDPDKEEREGLRAEKEKILKEHLGQESNIPLTSHYWQLSNRLRVLDKARQERAIVWGNRVAQTKGE